MNSKIEELASSRRRQPNPRFEEWAPPNAAIDIAARAEEEDRQSGKFPYGAENLLGMRDFYAGRDIFITGGSGFVGKVLIEKILRSLPEGGRVYLLLRGRRGQSAQQRVQAMLDLPIFKLLMTENPEAAERLVAMDGDCGSLGLGLSPTDRQTIIDNVSVVFHCAASVRFNLSTNHLILVNTRGTREIVYLCREMKKLASFVHISTAFCNATRDRTTPIPEEVLRQNVDWKTVIAVAERCESDPKNTYMLDIIFKKMTNTHVNNYTFTKALAEDILEDIATDLPTIIVRPTLVIASYEDPFGGWVDNLYGPMSIWDGVGQGVVRTHYGDLDLALDYVPVDLTVKTILAAAWHRGAGYRLSPDPQRVDVVNNGTSDITVHKVGKIKTFMQLLYDSATHRYILRYPRVIMVNYFWIFYFLTLVTHLPLGILVDTVLKLRGQKPMLLSIYRRLYFAQTTLLHFFSTREFKFDLKNQWIITARINKNDCHRFSMVTKNYPMSYYQDNVIGLIKYVFKEKAYTVENSNRKIMLYVDWIHSGLLIIFAVWLCSWLFFPRSTTAY